jgi:hypothetical protein
MGRFQSAIDQGARDAEAHLPHLQRVWRALVHSWGQQAARRLQTHSVTAAASWIAPTWSGVAPVTTQAVDAEGKTAKIRVAMVEAAMRPALVEFGLSFDVTNPLVERLLEQLGHKITRITETQRQITMEHIEQGRQQGLSIPHTAALVVKHSSGLYSQNRAQVVARTELSACQNGGSLAAARLVGVSTKQWLATGDNRTRPTHRDADGQQVPINEKFYVGVDLLDYPGDPAGSAAEIIQCRCTVTYPDA